MPRKSAHNFDGILVENIGGFGPWQFVIFLLLSIPTIFRSSESMIQTLSGFSPPHRSLFHQHFMSVFLVRKCFFAKNVTREKHFCFLVPKFRTKNARVKHWWNWRQVFVTLTFYEQLFCMKSLQFGFLIFWLKKIGQKMLVNLTAGKLLC